MSEITLSVYFEEGLPKSREEELKEELVSFMHEITDVPLENINTQMLRGSFEIIVSVKIAAGSLGILAIVGSLILKGLKKYRKPNAGNSVADDRTISGLVNVLEGVRASIKADRISFRGISEDGGRIGITIKDDKGKKSVDLSVNFSYEKDDLSDIMKF